MLSTTQYICVSTGTAQKEALANSSKPLTLVRSCSVESNFCSFRFAVYLSTGEPVYGFIRASANSERCEMTGHEDNVGFLATGSGVQQFQLSLWGSFVLPCRRLFPDLRSTTHTSSLRASAAAHSQGSPSGLTKHAQATTCRENDGSTLANLPAGDTQRVRSKSPVRANRTPGSVRGAPGNRCPYLDISISFLSLVALFALTSGCSTVKKGDGS